MFQILQKDFLLFSFIRSFYLSNMIFTLFHCLCVFIHNSVFCLNFDILFWVSGYLFARYLRMCESERVSQYMCVCVSSHIQSTDIWRCLAIN